MVGVADPLQNDPPHLSPCHTSPVGRSGSNRVGAEVIKILGVLRSILPSSDVAWRTP